MEKHAEDARRKAMVIDIDMLVPKDHLLRKIEKVMDYDWLYERLNPLYNDKVGRPGTDPVVLALLCDPVKTAELDRILLQGLTARQPGLAIEHDGVSPDGSPVLFGYFCDLPRIARFNTSLELSERPGTLICFDFQAEVLRSYCGSRVRFQTIDFTKFEGRLFP